MFTKLYFTLVALLFLTAKGDPDPQTFIASTPGPLLPSPSQQPQYEEKNVVVYLTPEQITALQTGQGVLEPVVEPQQQEDVEQQNQEQISQYELEQEIDQQNDFLGNQRFVIVQNQEEKEPASVKDSNQEEPQGLSRYLSRVNRYKNPNSERNNYYAPTQKRLENNRYTAPSTEKSEGRKSNAASSKKPKGLDYNYYSIYNNTNGDNINIKIIHPNAKLREVLGLKELDTQKTSALRKYKFVPYANLNKKLSDAAPTEESSQRSRTSQNSNGRQYAFLFSPAQSEVKQENEQEDTSENEQNEDEELNEARQDERKKILDFLKKQNAQAEAAKHPVVSKKVSTTRPVPYIFRVSQATEVKSPQSYPVPLEIIRRVPIEIEDTEREDERQAYKVEKSVRVPTAKKVYVKVDKPILVERIVPAGTRREVQIKPQKLRILGPTLKYLE